MRTRKYSKEVLIKQAQMLAKELGKSPTIENFYEDPRTASAITAMTYFGSWNQFLEEAGLKINRKRTYCTDEQLIAQVQMMAKELGRTPTFSEFGADERTSGSTTIIGRFGSWNQFLEAAGLKINKEWRLK